MPDTGAPWNLRFPFDTALVREAPEQFEDLADDVAAALNRGALVFSTAGSNTVALDFSANRVITRSATGAVTFTGSNYTAGNSVSVRIVAGGASRNLTFPAGWKFVSFKPTALASGKVGVLAVTSFGTVEGDAVCAWAAEA
jgi:hypothetical protein